MFGGIIFGGGFFGQGPAIIYATPRTFSVIASFATQPTATMSRATAISATASET